MAVPPQPGVASALASKPTLFTAVALSTVLEYQPTRVLMSVLFTALAPTRISTSPACATGTGTSSR